MTILIFTPKENQKTLKMAVRAAKLHEYLKKNNIQTMKVYNFDYRKLSFLMLFNYVKIFYFLFTKNKADTVLFENERSEKLLKFFKFFKCRLAIDIRDNRALQHSAYQIDDKYEVLDSIRNTLYKNIEYCDFVFVVTEGCKDLYPKKYHNKIYIIENSSDPDHFKMHKYYHNFRIGFLSGIAPGRGIEMLIDASLIVKEKFPQLQLTIGGKYNKEHTQSIDHYENLVNKYSNDWLIFHDDIAYSTNAPEFISNCSITVIPHPDHEHYHTTLAVKQFDYMACGRPIVATNCVETANVINQYKCGLVCDFTAEDMAQKIIYLLENPEISEEMGKNGRKAIEDYYNWNRMAQKMITYLSQEK
ncbi:MAG: glycosyltransferase family 4 protein [Ignavibacteriales bacterium]|nr:glycosyltransferase family 4 protein [Ignavibacteriales bacterium]